MSNDHDLLAFLLIMAGLVGMIIGVAQLVEAILS